LTSRTITRPDDTIQRIVVVGAGLGGLRTVERLRHRGYQGQIVLLGGERHLPYDRPPLSKQMLRAEVEPFWLRPGNDFSALDVTVRIDDPAVELDVERGVIVTRGGEVAYDAAVIATGAVPRRVPGVGGLVLRTLEDAGQLRASLAPGCRLGVIGAGLIGCEVAASARAIGAEVAVIDVLAGPLIRVVGPKVAGLVAELHAERGVTLHLGTGITGVSGRRLTLQDGTEHEFDVVLEAIGAAPDTAWLAGSAIELDDGVDCDADGRAAPNVYAVGDAARWGGRRSEHWTNAGQQADHVAAVILEQERPAADVAYWWSDQYDIKLQGLGQPGADDDVEVVRWGPKSRPVAVYSAGGRLTGVVGFSAAGAVMRLRADIAAGADVNEILDRLAS
jgi:3-phenylpropionate/trans-cinnamate dioxygenase ferredoxin reductase subunit